MASCLLETRLLKAGLYTIAALLLCLAIGCGMDDNSPPQNEDDDGTVPSLSIRKQEQAVLSRTNGLVADPTVIPYNDGFLMAFSDYSLESDSITFAAATSTDGINWSRLDNGAMGRIFSADIESWDKLIETADLNVINDSIYLYYIGYPNTDISSGIYAAQLGLATGNSPDEITRFGNQPVVPNGGDLDQDAITSPAVVFHEGLYYLLYTGWSNILTAEGFLGLTGATSPDGKNWTKLNQPVFDEVSTTMFETATEAELVAGPDGQFYLFFSAEGGIAMARSNAPFGPWEIYPDFIITPEFDWESGEVNAPSVIIEEELVRIWYAGVIGNFAGSAIGYAEIDFPLDWE